MLASILAFLGSLLGGPFATAAVEAFKAKLSADNSADKIAAGLAVQKAQIDAQREAVERSTLVAEEGRWGPFVRWGFAFPFVIYNAKVILWDRMAHLGATDVLSPDLLSLEQIIVAAYFGHSAVTIVGRALARRKA